MLVEQGAIEERHGTWVATERLAITSMPDSIHGVIAARLDLLDVREREALRRCSVMGRFFWPSAVGVDDDLVATLGRRAIVSEQGESAFSGRREFAFKHALTHEVAYATLPRYERGSLHRRVAEWLGELGSRPEGRDDRARRVPLRAGAPLGRSDDELRQRAFERCRAPAMLRFGAVRTRLRSASSAVARAGADRRRSSRCAAHGRARRHPH